MPASISFHVPDQYHKRIIGIGGQHIQRIMKKYSVFVKFSNAMDRGGAGKEDDDVKVDNVICRTPARNAQSLDLVKQEIMDMVEKVVSPNPNNTPPYLCIFTHNLFRTRNLYPRRSSSIVFIIESSLLECPKSRSLRRSGIARLISQIPNWQVTWSPFLVRSIKYLRPLMLSW